MKKLCLLLACLFLFGLTPALAEEVVEEPEILYYEIDETGKILTVSLDGNMTTGYTWSWTQHPEGLLEERSNDYVLDAAEAGLVGSGGKTIYTFAALEKAVAGTAKLAFAYGQEWEDAVELAFELEIEIDEQGNLIVAKAQQTQPFPWDVGDIVVCPECGAEDAEVMEIIYQGDEETGVSVMITIQCPECAELQVTREDLEMPMMMPGN